jgi:hypothetical protein
MVLFKDKVSLAIALFSLRIPAIYFIILIYSLFNTICYYKFGYSFFYTLQIIEYEELNPENVLSSINDTNSQIRNSITMLIFKLVKVKLALII